ncbi:hypothetical protein J6590_035018 [Homalodisca vitripennis]|nr:hypothetical protein J6590_035018 [Homalodisca vitripennis]
MDNTQANRSRKRFSDRSNCGILWWNERQLVLYPAVHCRGSADDLVDARRVVVHRKDLVRELEQTNAGFECRQVFWVNKMGTPPGPLRVGQHGYLARGGIGGVSSALGELGVSGPGGAADEVFATARMLRKGYER